jgi:rubrerythrin
MEGGIKAWNGLIAEGPPEAGMAYFAGAPGPAELIALAWHLESGSRAFYAGLAISSGDRESAALFEQLGKAEESHMEALLRLYRELAGPEASAAFPRPVSPQEPRLALMEGGVEVPRALEWARGKPPGALLEYCMALESNSYDLYLRMHTATAEPQARRVFELLVAEEKLHLERLAARFEQVIGGEGPGEGLVP